MTIHTRHSSRPTESVLPRAQSGFTREYIHGPLQPMEDSYGKINGFTALRYLACFALGIGLAIGAVEALTAIRDVVAHLWFAL